MGYFYADRFQPGAEAPIGQDPRQLAICIGFVVDLKSHNGLCMLQKHDPLTYAHTLYAKGYEAFFRETFAACPIRSRDFMALAKRRNKNRKSRLEEPQTTRQTVFSKLKCVVRKDGHAKFNLTREDLDAILEIIYWRQPRVVLRNYSFRTVVKIHVVGAVWSDTCGFLM